MQSLFTLAQERQHLDDRDHPALVRRRGARASSRSSSAPASRCTSTGASSSRPGTSSRSSGLPSRTEPARARRAPVAARAASLVARRSGARRTRCRGRCAGADDRAVHRVHDSDAARSARSRRGRSGGIGGARRSRSRRRSQAAHLAPARPTPSPTIRRRRAIRSGPAWRAGSPRAAAASSGCSARSRSRSSSSRHDAGWRCTARRSTRAARACRATCASSTSGPRACLPTSAPRCASSGSRASAAPRSRCSTAARCRGWSTRTRSRSAMRAPKAIAFASRAPRCRASAATSSPRSCRHGSSRSMAIGRSPPMPCCACAPTSIGCCPRPSRPLRRRTRMSGRTRRLLGALAAALVVALGVWLSRSIEWVDVDVADRAERRGRARSPLRRQAARAPARRRGRHGAQPRGAAAERRDARPRVAALEHVPRPRRRARALGARRRPSGRAAERVVGRRRCAAMGADPQPPSAASRRCGVAGGFGGAALGRASVRGVRASSWRRPAGLRRTRGQRRRVRRAACLPRLRPRIPHRPRRRADVDPRRRRRRRRRAGAARPRRHHDERDREDRSTTPRSCARTARSRSRRCCSCIPATASGSSPRRRARA